MKSAQTHCWKEVRDEFNSSEKFRVLSDLEGKSKTQNAFKCVHFLLLQTPILMQSPLEKGCKNAFMETVLARTRGAPHSELKEFLGTYQPSQERVAEPWRYTCPRCGEGWKSRIPKTHDKSCWRLRDRLHSPIFHYNESRADRKKLMDLPHTPGLQAEIRWDGSETTEVVFLGKCRVWTATMQPLPEKWWQKAEILRYFEAPEGTQKLQNLILNKVLEQLLLKQEQEQPLCWKHIKRY